MKKIFFFAMAAVAMSFAACGNKTTETVPEVDSIDTVAVIDEPQDALSLLDEVADMDNAQALLDQAKEELEALVANGDEEAAKEYAFKLQEWCEANKAKLSDANITTENIVEVVKSIPAATVEAAESAKEAAKADAKKVAEDTKAAVEEKVNEQVEAGKQAANEAANKAIEDAASAAKKKLGLK